jgi:hypothetical protein
MKQCNQSMSQLKTKKCKSCGEKFIPSKPLQIVCGWECANSLTAKNKLKAIRKEQREERKKLKNRREWLKDAQAAFNSYIRYRDRDEPCISCGRHHTGQYHAGHYMATSIRPSLRFNEDNVHKQCQPCNTHLHGNLLSYRIELIKKIGQDKVDLLESPPEFKKWSISELEGICIKYRKLAREANNG